MRRIGIDTYVIDTLMRDLVGHERKPSAFIVYLFLWRRVAASRAASVHLSHQAIAEATGLSRSAVQSAIRVLTDEVGPFASSPPRNLRI